MSEFFNLSSLNREIMIWLIIGFTGQSLFAMRFIVQWIKSERQRKSTIPVTFWYFSIVGGLITLAYALHQRDPVFIAGQLFGVLVYGRNLYFIYHEKRLLAVKQHVA